MPIVIILSILTLIIQKFFWELSKCDYFKYQYTYNILPLCFRGEVVTHISIVSFACCDIKEGILIKNPEILKQIKQIQQNNFKIIGSIENTVNILFLKPLFHLQKIKNINIIPCYGIKVSFNKIEYLLGNRKLLDYNQVQFLKFIQIFMKKSLIIKMM